MEYKNVIGDEVRRLRVDLKISQADLALRLQIAGWDVDRGHVSKIECGLIHVSDYHQIFLAEVLEVPVERLFPKKREDITAREYVLPILRSRGKIPYDRDEGIDDAICR